MERNSQFMSLPKSMVDALQKEEMLLVAGGSVGQEASTTNNQAIAKLANGFQLV